MLEADIIFDVYESTSKLLLAELADKLVIKEKLRMAFLGGGFSVNTLVLALHLQYTCSEAFKKKCKISKKTFFSCSIRQAGVS